MRPSVLVDTGPLVALLSRRDAYHQWTVDRLREVAGPMLTCEAVISEVMFLLQHVGQGPAQVMGLLSSGGLRVTFAFAHEVGPVRKLLAKYADVPMAFADACLVRMSELMPAHKVLTLDSDFRIYRRRRNQPLPLLIPD